MAPVDDCTTRIPEMRARNGLFTAPEAERLYGISRESLRRLRERGVLTTVTPLGMVRPVLYRRDELNSVLLGVGR